MLFNSNRDAKSIATNIALFLQSRLDLADTPAFIEQLEAITEPTVKTAVMREVAEHVKTYFNKAIPRKRSVSAYVGYLTGTLLLTGLTLIAEETTVNNDDNQRSSIQIATGIGMSLSLLVLMTPLSKCGFFDKKIKTLTTSDTYLVPLIQALDPSAQIDLENGSLTFNTHVLQEKLQLLSDPTPATSTPETELLSYQETEAERIFDTLHYQIEVINNRSSVILPTYTAETATDTPTAPLVALPPYSPPRPR